MWLRSGRVEEWDEVGGLAGTDTRKRSHGIGLDTPTAVFILQVRSGTAIKLVHIVSMEMLFKKYNLSGAPHGGHISVCVYAVPSTSLPRQRTMGPSDPAGYLHHVRQVSLERQNFLILRA